MLRLTGEPESWRSNHVTRPESGSDTELVGVTWVAGSGGGHLAVASSSGAVDLYQDGEVKEKLNAGPGKSVVGMTGRMKVSFRRTSR